MTDSREGTHRWCCFDQKHQRKRRGRLRRGPQRAGAAPFTRWLWSEVTIAFMETSASRPLSGSLSAPGLVPIRPLGARLASALADTAAGGRANEGVLLVAGGSALAWCPCDRRKAGCVADCLFLAPDGGRRINDSEGVSGQCRDSLDGRCWSRARRGVSG